MNAGDGKHQHPTQALLDLYTIQDALGRLEGVHVAIVGDVLHSRVARSLVQALRLVGAQRDARRAAAARAGRARRASRYDIDAIRDADVVYVLRMQRERMEEGANYVPDAARVQRALVRHARAAAPGPEGDAPRADEPRRRDRPARRRLGATRSSSTRCAPGSSCGWRCSTTCSRPGRSRSRRPWRSHDGACSSGRSGARRPRRSAARACSTRPSGVDAVLDVRVDGGTIVAARRGARRERPPRDRRRRARARAGVRRPARAPAHAGPRGRGDDRVAAPRPPRPAATARSSRCRTPIPVVDSTDVLRGLRARAAERGRGAGRLHGRDHDRPARHAADRDGRARRRRRRRVHRRRPPGRERRADAARARVQRDHRPPARAPLRGADADAAAATCTWARSRPSSGSAAGRRSARASASRASSRSPPTRGSRCT